jgi:hypothetical protein
MVFGVMAAAVPAAADPDPTQVCAPLDSSKIDTVGDPLTVTITAPEGKLITGYCVKAGSAQRGDGPVYVTLTTPVSSLEISHPTGKAISNYSYSLGTAPAYYYTPRADAEETVCTLVGQVWQMRTFGPVTVTGEPMVKDAEWTDEQKAAEDAKLQPAADLKLANEESDFDIDRTGEQCLAVETYDYTPSATASATACTLVEGTWTSGYPFSVTVTGSLLTKDTPWTTEEEAAEDAKLQSEANDALAALMGTATIDGSGTSCTPAPPPPPTPPTAPEPVSVVQPATVVEPAVVEVPETVAVPAPATVPVPAKVTLPATIPAGSGPTIPVYALALLVLAATALTATTVRLVRTTK